MNIRIDLNRRISDEYLRKQNEYKGIQNVFSGSQNECLGEQNNYQSIFKFKNQLILL